MPSGIEGHPTEAYDFRTLDFDQLWLGRDRTTLLEREVVRRSIGRAPTDRVLEVGPGHGRITPVLRSRFREYAAIDITPGFLGEMARREPDLRALFVADAASLPFADRSFSAVSMVRVYNFLLDPDVVLREIHRVLAPGGVLVFSYHHVPSLGTFFEDLRYSLAARPPDGFVPITFRRREILLPRRSRVVNALVRAGFELEVERVTGLEDFGPGRRLPARTLFGLSEALARSSLLPQRFVEATRPGIYSGNLPTMDEILACPRCRVGWSKLSSREEWGIQCPNCGGRFGRIQGGLLDLLSPPDESGRDRAVH